MGYFGGAYYTYTNQYIWSSSSNISFDYVNCIGNESQLMDCFHSENTTCNYYEGVWIYCNSKAGIGETAAFVDCFITKLWPNSFNRNISLSTPIARVWLVMLFYSSIAKSRVGSFAWLNQVKL